MAGCRAAHCTARLPRRHRRRCTACASSPPLCLLPPQLRSAALRCAAAVLCNAGSGGCPRPPGRSCIGTRARAHLEAANSTRRAHFSGATRIPAGWGTPGRIHAHRRQAQLPIIMTATICPLPTAAALVSVVDGDVPHHPTRCHRGQ
jgi:hypothetical protein